MILDECLDFTIALSSFIYTQSIEDIANITSLIVSSVGNVMMVNVFQIKNLYQL